MTPLNRSIVDFRTTVPFGALTRPPGSVTAILERPMRAWMGARALASSTRGQIPSTKASAEKETGLAGSRSSAADSLPSPQPTKMAPLTVGWPTRAVSSGTGLNFRPLGKVMISSHRASTIESVRNRY